MQGNRRLQLESQDRPPSYQPGLDREALQPETSLVSASPVTTSNYRYSLRVANPSVPEEPPPRYSEDTAVEGDESALSHERAASDPADSRYSFRPEDLGRSPYEGDDETYPSNSSAAILEQDIDSPGPLLEVTAYQPYVAVAEFIDEWADLQLKYIAFGHEDDPKYWIDRPKNLSTSSIVHSFAVGTADDIFSSVFPALEEAQSELIFVTCFWAASSVRNGLVGTLRKLSAKAQQRGGSKLRVRIGFSSVPHLQKLSHTTSLEGQVYPPSSWAKKLGLPPPEELQGLDMEVKSIYIRPYSVMHPKFIILDRKRVWLPSCNVSWEAWLEGCIELSGAVVSQFVQFWIAFWDRKERQLWDWELPEVGREFDRETRNLEDPDGQRPESSYYASRPSTRKPLLTANSIRNPTELPKPSNGPSHISRFFDHDEPLQAVFLPSPHHSRPNWNWFSTPPLDELPTDHKYSKKNRLPPPTPLNTFILKLLSSAKSSIYIQTPNINSPILAPVLLRAVYRGVEVHIVTSEGLMLVEQLVTARNTTGTFLKELIKNYERIPQKAPLRIDYFRSRHLDYAAASAAAERRGAKLSLFAGKGKGDPKAKSDSQLALSSAASAMGQDAASSETLRSGAEPAASHLKLLIVDGERVILGSGNMDRASWYTSQELGVAFFSKELATEIKTVVDEAMVGRTRSFYGRRDWLNC